MKNSDIGIDISDENITYFLLDKVSRIKCLIR